MTRRAAGLGKVPHARRRRATASRPAAAPRDGTARRPRSLVVLNPAAGGGRAAQRWSRVEPVVRLCSHPSIVVATEDGRWVAALHAAATAGVRWFIAAGGDGTVNAVAHAIVEMQRGQPVHDVDPFVLGAVGLGSSNDFHKPARRRVGAVPIRIDPTRTRWHDVGRARYRNGGEPERCRHFVVSASMGLPADANARFSRSDPFPRWLRGSSTSAAIAYAALASLARYRTSMAKLESDALGRQPMTVALTSLSVMKTPYLSGWLRYDHPVEVDDGSFAVNLCHGMTRSETVAALLDLSRGRFVQCRRPSTAHWRARQLTVTVERSTPLELDGEILSAQRVDFQLLPRQLRCCA